MRTSQAVMRSMPPPMHQPWIAATTGFGQSATAVIEPWRRPISCRVRMRAAAPLAGSAPANVPPMAARSRPVVK